MQHSPAFSPNNNPANELGREQKLLILLLVFSKLLLRLELNPWKPNPLVVS